MLIKPPSNEPEPEEPLVLSISREEINRRISIHLNVKPWICPSCGLTNFGHNKHCADYRCKIPRPVDFKIEDRK